MRGPTTSALVFLLAASGCTDDTVSVDETGAAEASETTNSTGDGDGDPSGDGDGDPSGDGDGEATGDGDGDPCGPECCPGETQCVDDQSEVCNADGSAWELLEDCDPIQGLSCNPDAGVCEGICAALELGQTNLGCDFYPTITLQFDDTNGTDHEFAVAVANEGDEDAMVLVTQGEATILDTVVPAGAIEVVVLPWVPELTEGEGPSALTLEGAYRLRSDRPVGLVQHSPLRPAASNDASLLRPAHTWGTEVVVATWPHLDDAQLSIPAFYYVVAQRDGTSVTLSPPSEEFEIVPGGGVEADGTGGALLDAGDVLQVITAAGDLSGAIVSADKPIQVIAGHKCTFLPWWAGGCDHIEAALPPTSALATHYIVAPPAEIPDDYNHHGHIVHVLASEDQTTVSFEPDQELDGVLEHAGDFIEVEMGTESFAITSDKPVLVMQYMVGQAAGYGIADPSMLLTVAPEQFRREYLFFAPATWGASYADVTAPTGTVVSVDGVEVDYWFPIADTGYSSAHVQLDNGGDGSHTLVADAPVGLSVYGAQSAGSYWNPGGFGSTR